MRRSLPVSRVTRLPVAFAILSLVGSSLVATAVHAGTNGTWTNATTGGLWSATGNWSGGTVADGQDGIANFSTLDITADNTVHLDMPGRSAA